MKNRFHVFLNIFFLLAFFATSAAFAVTIDLSTVTPNANGVIEVNNGDVLTGTLDGSTRPYKVSIADGATVTLQNATVNGVHGDDYKWAGITCKGDCKIILAEGTKNTVKGFHSYYPGIYVPEGKTLTIDGSGELSASNNSDEQNWRFAAGIGGGLNMSCGNIVINNGIINATSGFSGAGAAIGAGVVYQGTFTMGDITISGGTVNATADEYSSGAAIGTGYNSGSINMGNITISGGTVNATVGEYGVGAGIGAGYNEGSLTMGDITISGGTVNATVGEYGGGAGIGTGGNTSSLAMGNITISGGTVTATGAGAGIGIGYNQGTITCAGITISKEVAILIAIKGENAVHSIGIGYNDPDYGGTFSCNKITIGGVTKEFIETSPFTYSSSVTLSDLKKDYVANDGVVLTGTLGGNYKVSIADGATVTLKNATIQKPQDATGEWAGITCEGDCKIILAEGTTNTVNGFHYNYPGIYVPKGKTLTIDGNGELSASTVSDEDGLRYAAGIGGGLNMSCGNIVINNGIINATGGEMGGGAGIGAGAMMDAERKFSCGNITISGGTVTATVGIGGGGAGIGAGYNEGSLTMGDITISGGTVTTTVDNYGVGAGIGAGYNGGSLTMGDITISGGIVTATVGKESAGAGIGIGYNSGDLAMGDIKISGGIVSATVVDQFSNGAGIGTGYNEGSVTIDDITISGGTVTATGAGAGIGIGFNQGTVTCKGITISKEVTSLIAIKGEYAVHSIGIGYNGGGTFSCDKITIGGEETNFIETSPFIFPKRTYTIVFDGNGGSGSMENQALSLGDVLQANTFTRQGYVFDDWNTAKDGSGMSFKDGAKVLEFLGTNTNVTFYAQWWDGTFSNVVDLVNLTGDYVAKLGDVLTGTLGGNYKVSIADGAIVELNGVTINGINSPEYKWAGITCEGSCNIVLAEGTTNTLKGFFENYPGIHVPEGSTLTIEGSGSLEASSNGWGAGIGGGYYISCGNIVIKGGTVTATGGNRASGIGGGAGVSCSNITITNGVTKVTAIKGGDAPYSIGKGDNGSVGTITIGSNVVTDGIEESPYEFIPPLFEVVEKDGKTLASFNGNFIGTEPLVIAEETSVDKIEFNRSFPTGKFSTVVLPFDVNTSNVSGLDAVLFYNGIGTDKDGNDAIRMKVVWATDKWVEDNQIKDKNDKLMQYAHVGLTANTPYMMQMSNPTFKVNNTAPIVLKQTAKAETDKDGWTFRGTWEYRKWEEGDSDLGYAYGFAASASKDDNINVGDFVRVGVGAWIAPMRAYLVKSEIPPKKVQAIRANGNYVMRPSAVRKELPELMSVIIGGDEDSNEEQTTVIGHFNTRTGEFKMNRSAGARTFDLKGRYVGDKANRARGAYYGKRVLK